MPDNKSRDMEHIRNFFEKAINNPLLPDMCENKPKLLDNMLDAFWEDVCIFADLSKVLQFVENKNSHGTGKNYFDMVDEDDFSKWKHNLFEDMDFEKVNRNIDLARGGIKEEVWESLLPFFLYVLPDIDEKKIQGLTLDVFKTYDFVFSLGLLIGKNGDYEGKTIIEAFRKDMSRILNRMQKNKEEKLFAEEIDELQESLPPIINGEEEILELRDDISKAVRTVYKSLNGDKPHKKGKGSDRALGQRIESGNFEIMRVLMERYGKNAHKGYVVYCFNILTGWFDYIFYVKYKSLNQLCYQGLALKEAAGAYFCIEGLGGKVADKLTCGFWEEAERLREEAAAKLIKEGNLPQYTYAWHTRLYDAVVKNEISLGKKRDFFTYWIEWFGIEGEEESWEYIVRHCEDLYK